MSWEQFSRLVFKNFPSPVSPGGLGIPAWEFFQYSASCFFSFCGLMIFHFVPSPSFAFTIAAQTNWWREGGDLASALLTAMDMASCGKGGDGMKEETGVEQRKRDQHRAASCFSGNLPITQLWAGGPVSTGPCQKCTSVS
jgi:hypothetical protein